MHQTLNTMRPDVETIGEIITRIGENHNDSIKLLNLLSSYRELGSILLLDNLELRGERIYNLFKDCCNEDIDKLILVLNNYNYKKLTKEDIYDHLSCKKIFEYESLIPLHELSVTK